MVERFPSFGANDVPMKSSQTWFEIASVDVWDRRMESRPKLWDDDGLASEKQVS
jgi:hypothetical protein